ncbi:UNVERIFIED_CONTAM: hypothetical protein LK11_13430 [Mumia flava]
MVRPAETSELDRAGQVVVDAYDTAGYLTLADGTTDEYYAGLLRDAPARARTSEVLVAVIGSEVVGSVTWCGAGSPMRELATRPDQGEFRMLGVDPSAGGRGVASAMVRWCLERAEADGLAEVVISSLPEMLPAHAVYRRFGFDRRPDLDWSPIDGVDLVGFSRAI